MTLWHKPAYVASDRDPITREILPGAIPPGLYCEDKATLGRLRAAARVRETAVTATLDGAWRLDGQPVYVATPAQARFFRAVASKEPPPPGPDPVAGIEANLRSLESLRGAGKPAAPAPSTPPATRHPFLGANRAQRRAGAARARRRA